MDNEPIKNEILTVDAWNNLGIDFAMMDRETPKQEEITEKNLTTEGK